MQTDPNFLADLPAPIFKERETYSAFRRVAAEAGGVTVSVSARRDFVSLNLITEHMTASASVNAAFARALAAELVASADLIERGQS